MLVLVREWDEILIAQHVIIIARPYDVRRGFTKFAVALRMMSSP
jgi:hypothetical protein